MSIRSIQTSTSPKVNTTSAMSPVQQQAMEGLKGNLLKKHHSIIQAAEALQIHRITLGRILNGKQVPRLDLQRRLTNFNEELRLQCWPQTINNDVHGSSWVALDITGVTIASMLTEADNSVLITMAMTTVHLKRARNILPLMEELLRRKVQVTISAGIDPLEHQVIGLRNFQNEMRQLMNRHSTDRLFEYEEVPLRRILPNIHVLIDYKRELIFFEQYDDLHLTVEHQ